MNTEYNEWDVLLPVFCGKLIGSKKSVQCGSKVYFPAMYGKGPGITEVSTCRKCAAKIYGTKEVRFTIYKVWLGGWKWETARQNTDNYTPPDKDWK